MPSTLAFYLIFLQFLPTKATFDALRPIIFPTEVRKLANITNIIEYGKYFGYDIVTYEVTTEDGYTLQLQRLANVGGRPILLMHGLLSSSWIWLLLGPKTPALAYLLYEQGYDVWLGNTRGTPHGMQHETLDPKKDGEFWRFSFHEIGLYDLPAMIDFILQATANDKLSYIGYSQGCTSFFVLTSMLPSYNDKISIMHALAPAVYLSNARSPLLPLLDGLVHDLKFPYLGTVDITRIHAWDICFANIFTFNTCLNGFGQATGENLENLNKTMVLVYSKHLTLPISVHQLLHYYQVYQTGIFGTFDIDFLHHRPVQTSAYPLEKVTVPIALYHGRNDFAVDVRDVKILNSKLSNVVEKYLVPNSKYNHLDFSLGKDAYKAVYKHLLQVQRKFEKANEQRATSSGYNFNNVRVVVAGQQIQIPQN